MQFRILLEIITVLVVLMLVGYFGARRGIITSQVNKVLSSLVFNLFLVSSVFSSICEDVPEMSGGSLLHITLILSLTIAVCYIVAAVSIRIFMGKNPAAPVAEILISAMNTLLFGLPIVQQVYGSMAVLYMGLSSVAFNILLYSYGVMRMNRDKGHGISLKRMFTPIFIATILATAILFLRIPLPGILHKFLSTTAPTTLPLSMIVLGATIGAGNLVEAFRDRRVYLVSFIRLILCPIVVFLVLSPMNIDPILLRTSVVIAGCPCGVVVPVLALQYDQDALFASRSVMASTILSVITLPAVIMLLG